MVRKPTMLFVNLFDSNKITPDRLLVFGKTVLCCLVAGNDKGQFFALITALTAALDALAQELSDVDSGLQNQVSNTKIVEVYMALFSAFMSEQEPFIARALGDRDTLAYHAFYPHGITEYSSVTKTTMRGLTVRVKTAAIAHATPLGSELSSTLEAFAAGFDAKYEVQQHQISTVKKDRSQKSIAYTGAQLALTTAVCTVAGTYPGDVEKCNSFFPFQMLYTQRKRPRETAEGTLAHGEGAMIKNFAFNKSADINVINTGSSAPLRVWLAASPADAMPDTAMEVDANAEKNIKPVQLSSDLKKHTFLMVKNTSDINSGAYTINLIGLTKPKVATPKDGSKAKRQNKMKVVKEDAA